MGDIGPDAPINMEEGHCSPIFQFAINYVCNSNNFTTIIMIKNNSKRLAYPIGVAFMDGIV